MPLSSNISKTYIGSDEISKIYCGPDTIYTNGGVVPPPEAYQEDQRSALAYVAKGNIDLWTNPATAPQQKSFGFTLGHGSWPVYNAWTGSDKVTKTITVWRNPDGGLWDQPGRYGTIEQWHVGQDRGWSLNVEANKAQLVLPWGDSFVGAGGTQAESPDNGLIILTSSDGSTGYALQGLTRIEDDISGHLTLFSLNLKFFGDQRAYIGHYRCDGVRRIEVLGPDPQTYGLGMFRTLLKPRHLDEDGWGDDEMIGFMGFNVNWGPGALHAGYPGDHIEHTENTQPVYGGMVPLPKGASSDMMRCAEGFALEITDGEIEAWITSEGATGALAESKRNFAKGFRGPVDDNGLPTRARVILYGTGSAFPIMDSTGGVNPDEQALWSERGIDTEQKANQLGRNILNYGTLRAVRRMS